MSPGRWSRMLLGLGLYCGAFVIACAVGGLGYFHFADPRQSCASCHEMIGVTSNWTASSHRTVSCRACHGGSLTLDVHALRSHVDRIVRHFTGDPNKPVRLLAKHVLPLHESCRQCHPQAFADWQVSRHSTTYARIFLDPTHNATASPTNDCLRCHGMFFEGDISGLVARSSGALDSWALRDPAKAVEPAIPCLTCHQVHAPSGDTRAAGLFDHRERAHFSAFLLPAASVFQGGRAVRLSTDLRQRVCMECHAPSAAHQLGTSDDRTPAGVHEGLSCLDCHGAHAHSATASCSACHPADSHCGIEVQKMDTTFLSASSKHNVHTVACLDCHPQGVPAKAQPKL
jgi:Cytochrome c554 and c-prime